MISAVKLPDTITVERRIKAVWYVNDRQQIEKTNSGKFDISHHYCLTVSELMDMRAAIDAVIADHQQEAALVKLSNETL